jgi:hypothetical protein
MNWPLQNMTSLLHCVFLNRKTSIIGHKRLRVLQNLRNMPPRPNSYSCVTNSVTSTVILPVLLDRREVTSLKLTAANRLRVLAVVRRQALSGDS